MAAVRDAVVETDTESLVVAWNRGAEQLYGWCADEAIGRSAMELLRPELGADRAELLA